MLPLLEPLRLELKFQYWGVGVVEVEDQTLVVLAQRMMEEGEVLMGEQDSLRKAGEEGELKELKNQYWKIYEL